LNRFREPINGLTHLGGAIAAVLGQVVLVMLGWPGALRLVSVIVYGFSLIAMFSASATYHLARAGPGIQEILRKLDHSAIYLLIAGTYTPFCLNAFTGFWRWGLLAIIWAFAVIGILVKVFVVRAPRWLNALVYVLMGWLCLMAAPQMTTVLSRGALAWLIVGGVVYTIGAIVYATKVFDFIPGKFGFHEVWHLFVLAGAAAHFVAVLGVIRPTG
jgi:hemolysin III